MIHDAIFLLWDYPIKTESSHPQQDFQQLANDLDSYEKEIFLKIIKISKTHGLIKRFIKKYSFASGEQVHRRHNKFIYSRSGLYVQALSEGLDEILVPYQESLVDLEKHALNNPNLTLSFVLGIAEKHKYFLNTITRLLFSIKENKLYGCQILNVLQQYSLNGDKETSSAIKKLICIVHRVFYEQLCAWMLYGTIKDYQKEFFIQTVERIPVLSPTVNITKTSLQSNEETSALSLDISNKQEKNIDYEINAIMLPHYIPISLAQNILFIGKSVVLFDSSPVEANRSSMKFLSIENDFRKRFTIWGNKEEVFHKTIQELKNMDNFDIFKLNMLVDEIKSCVTEHLWIMAGEEAGVMHELQLMKDYFLVGRGELFLELLRLATPLLNSQPTSVSTRDLNNAFNTAARAVFLGNNKDIEKFSFSIPFNKPLGSDSFVNNYEFGVLDGWSTITLKYNVKWPLHLLFTPDILQRYNEIFRFLLRLKKTQHDLHVMWRTFKQTRKYGGSLWQLHNKLMFLMDHLQHYLQADVLESNFSKLKFDAEKIKDFELLKTAHNIFLTDILSQSFLLMNPTNDDARCGYIDYQLNPVLSNIMELLQLCDSVCSIANDIKSHQDEAYLVTGYTRRFDCLVKKLLQLLTALRTQPCGTHLARLLMRLDFNRWFSSTAQLTQSVSLML